MLGLMSNVSVAGLSPRRLLVDGAVLCLSFSAFVFGTSYLNPWLWFEDYPPEIQALVPNPPEVPLWQVLPLALFSLGFILFLLVRSATALLREGGKRHGFLLAAVHTFVLMQIVNAWDVLIIDWLIFVTIQPAFVYPSRNRGITRVPGLSISLLGELPEPYTLDRDNHPFSHRGRHRGDAEKSG